MIRRWMLVVPFVLVSLGVGSDATFAVYTSNVDLILEGKAEVVDPVNPLEPEKPVKPVNPNTPGTPGQLGIDYVSNIYFGKHRIGKETSTFYANLERVISADNGAEIAVPNYVQVTDNRGNNKGWQLNVRQADQLKNGNHVLEGAQLTLLNTKLVSPSRGKEPASRKNIRLNPVSGEASEVMYATENQGTGTWIGRFGEDTDEGRSSIQLTVPGDTKKYEGHYSTTLIWELLDSPI